LGLEEISNIEKKQREVWGNIFFGGGLVIFSSQGGSWGKGSVALGWGGFVFSYGRGK